MNNFVNDFCLSKLCIPLVFVTVFLLGACSSPPKVIKTDETRVQAFAQHGYDSGIAYETSSTKSSLKIGNEFIQITIVQPEREGKYPLVIYFPGLGESGDAGQGMRTAWAKSGYVVLSMQPLKEDENIWSSEAARRADFTNIRHDRYSAGVISNRLIVITKVLEILKQGVMSDSMNFQHMDLSQIAITGFDVGASSAMIVAGEEVPNVSGLELPLHPNVVIALSPHADFSGSAFGTRYQNINIPALSVTSDADDDTHGNEATSLHQLPFQRMPPGNKFLLLLSGASHSLIGNRDVTNEVQTEGEGESKQAEHEKSGSDSGRTRGGRRGKKGSASGGNAGSLSKRDAGRSPTQRAMVKVAIEEVTTAFLNAYVKKDRFAIEWLNKEAQPWLYDIGQLQEK